MTSDRNHELYQFVDAMIEILRKQHCHAMDNVRLLTLLLLLLFTIARPKKQN